MRWSPRPVKAAEVSWGRGLESIIATVSAHLEMVPTGMGTGTEGTVKVGVLGVIWDATGGCERLVRERAVCGTNS